MSIFSFLTVKPLVNTMRKKLEEQFKKPIPCFDIIYVSATDILSIVVDGTFYPYAADNIKELVKTTAKKKLKPFQQLDVITARINESNDINVILCMSQTINGKTEKVKSDFKL
jgi:hypothetical protein